MQWLVIGLGLGLVVFVSYTPVTLNHRVEQVEIRPWWQSALARSK